MSSTSNASFSCCFWGIAETARETLLDMKILYIINIYYFLLLVNLRIKKGTGHNLQPGSINKFMGRFSFLSSSTPLRYKQKKTQDYYTAKYTFPFCHKVSKWIFLICQNLRVFLAALGGGLRRCGGRFPNAGCSVKKQI